MAPGATNNWFIEVYGIEGSAKFSTHNPKAFEFLVSNGKEQGWTRIDYGSQSSIPSITGGIFEFGFSDAFQQMIGADPHHKETRQDVGPADGMEEYLKGEWLGDHRQKVREFGSAVSEDEAHRVLHPGIGDEDPHS